MPKVLRARKRTPSTVKPMQLSLLDLIGERRLGAEQTEALRGLLAAKTPSTTWRGLTIMPPGSLLDRAVSLFARTTDFPLELPAFMVLHIMAAYLLDRGVEIEVAGTRLKPDLWSTLLAPSGAGKTKTASVLARVMPVRLFPETTTSARFIEELAAHNRGLWLQDEWGQFLRRIETQSYAEEMREYLLRAHDGKPLARRTAIVKAEIFQAKIGHRPSKRELISGVRDIQNNAMAEFVLEVMTPLPGANDNTGLADDKAAA